VGAEGARENRLPIVVSATEVARQYGDGGAAVHALRGVSLEVERGKLTAIMGPVGIGQVAADAHPRRPGQADAPISGRKPDTAFYDLLRRAGLADRRTHRPAELSGGQQQRVAIARAFISKPSVVFADEPTGNLDSTAGGEILDLIRASVDSYGLSTVMVTHDPYAAAIADRVLFLADGQIVRDLGRSRARDVLAAIEELTAV